MSKRSIRKRRHLKPEKVQEPKPAPKPAPKPSEADDALGLLQQILQDEKSFDRFKRQL